MSGVSRGQPEMQATAISLREDASKHETLMVEMCNLSPHLSFLPYYVYNTHMISQLSQSDGENKVLPLMSSQSSQGAGNYRALWGGQHILGISRVDRRGPLWICSWSKALQRRRRLMIAQVPEDRTRSYSHQCFQSLAHSLAHSNFQ